MALVFGGRALGGHMRHLQIVKLDFYWPRKFSRNFWPGRPGRPNIPGESPWPVKVQFRDFQMLPLPFLIFSGLCSSLSWSCHGDCWSSCGCRVCQPIWGSSRWGGTCYGSHTIFCVFVSFCVCVLYSFSMKGVLMILRLVETWLRAGPPHTPQVCIG